MRSASQSFFVSMPLVTSCWDIAINRECKLHAPIQTRPYWQNIDDPGNRGSQEGTTRALEFMAEPVQFPVRHPLTTYHDVIHSPRGRPEGALASHADLGG